MTKEKPQVNKTIMENILNPFLLDKELPSITYQKTEITGLDKQKELYIKVSDYTLKGAHTSLDKIKKGEI